MNQLNLNVKISEILDDAEGKLRGLVMEASREVMAVRSVIQSLFVPLSDGSTAEVQPAIGSVMVNGQPAGNVFVLTDILSGLHNLLGQPVVQSLAAPVETIPSPVEQAIPVPVEIPAAPVEQPATVDVLQEISDLGVSHQ